MDFLNTLIDKIIPVDVKIISPIAAISRKIERFILFTLPEWRFLINLSRLFS